MGDAGRRPGRRARWLFLGPLWAAALLAACCVPVALAEASTSAGEPDARGAAHEGLAKERKEFAVADAGEESHDGKVAEGDRAEAPEAQDEDSFEEEEEEEEVPAVTLTVGIMVFAFLFINMCILHCINFPDPNIRSYVWRMMSTTISVFLAVVANEAINSFITEQILPSPFPRGFNIKVTWTLKLFVGAALLVVFYLVLNILAFALRRSRGKGYIYALKVIGGHLTAFAGISVFTLLQQTEFFSRSFGTAVLVAFIAAVVMAVMRRGSHKLRKWLHERTKVGFQRIAEGGVLGHERNEVDVDHDPDFQWADEVSEAEDEGMALILSFLARQIALFAIVSRLLPPRGDPDLVTNTWQKFLLLLVGTGCLVAMGIFAGFLTYHKYMHLKVNKASRSAKAATCINALMDSLWQDHVTNTIQSTFAMTSSLCFCRLVEWIVRCRITDMAMIQVATAVCVTTLVLVSIVALDKVADAMIPEEAESLEEAQHRRATMTETNRPILEQAPSTSGTSLSEKEGGGPADGFDSNHMTSQLKEFTLRRIIEGLGLAVGISWEKAFHVSEETLIEGIEVTRTHPVVSKLAFGFVLIVVIFPAWLWYLVPKARMHWKDFQQQMDLSRDVMSGPGV